MASRTYRRDSKGRFAGGGSPQSRAAALRRRTLPVVAGGLRQPRFPGHLLKAGAAQGTAKPRGTLSGTTAGRQRDQFVREMGGPRGAKVRRVNRTAPARFRAFSGSWERSTAPRGTISKSKTGRTREQDATWGYGGMTPRREIYRVGGTRTAWKSASASRRRR